VRSRNRQGVRPQRHVVSTGSELGTRVAVGLRWSALDQVVQQVMRISITALLAHLVAPAEFGLMAMALVFSNLGRLLGDLGLAPGLIQRRQLTDRHISTAFVMGGLVGLLLAAILAALSGPIAGFYHQPRLRPMLLVLSLTFVFAGLTGTPHSLLRRSFMFRPFVFCYALAVGIGGTTGVVIALLGGGVWALILAAVVESFIASVAAIAITVAAGLWTPSLRFDRAALRDLMGFGASVSASRLLLYGRQNLDNLLVGRVLGATALGLYNLAYSMMLYPIQRVSDVVSNVSLAAFSSIQDDRTRMAAAYRRAVRTICLVVFPLSIGSLIAAPVIVPVVFGPRWMPAVATVQILALNGPRIAFTSLNTSALQAIGRPSWELLLQIAMSVLMTVAFFVGVQFNIEAVAAGFTIVGYLILPFALSLMKRALGIGSSQLLGAIAPVVAATGVMALAAEFARRLTAEALPLPAQLVIVVVVGAIAYLLALLAVGRTALRQAAQDVLRRGRTATASHR
jgi:O-antigen/teichoic acid export membrane protein